MRQELGETEVTGNWEGGARLASSYRVNGSARVNGSYLGRRSPGGRGDERRQGGGEAAPRRSATRRRCARTGVERIVGLGLFLKESPIVVKYKCIIKASFHNLRK
jgi:hypothetical protein